MINRARKWDNGKAGKTVEMNVRCVSSAKAKLRGGGENESGWTSEERGGTRDWQAENEEKAGGKSVLAKRNLLVGGKDATYTREQARKKRDSGVTWTEKGRANGWYKRQRRGGWVSGWGKGTTKSFNDDFTRRETTRATMVKSKFAASRAAN